MAQPVDPTASLLGRLADDARLIRRAGFLRLYETAQPVPVADLASRCGMPETRVEEAIAALAGSGMASLGANGTLLAAGGLSVEPTQHRLRLAGREFFTWCGFDAVGIPAALGVDGLVRTPCGLCTSLVQVAVDTGEPPVDGSVMGWLPRGPCDDMQADFCAAANLFCDAHHLTDWRTAAGDPLGRPATLRDLATEGRHVWAEMQPRTDVSRDLFGRTTTTSVPDVQDLALVQWTPFMPAVPQLTVDALGRASYAVR